MDSELHHVAECSRGVRAPKFRVESHVSGVAYCARAPRFGVLSMQGSSTQLGGVPR